MDAVKAILPAAQTPEQKAAEYFDQLHSHCESVSKLSLSDGNLVAVAESYQFASELNLWCEAIEKRNEAELLRGATIEYEYGLLALVQGHYRHAFKSTRLVLELVLQAVYLSANELELREWLDNRADTEWSKITDKQDGVFSPRFAGGFFPELKGHVQHYGGIAVLLYRECSESVHGNIPKYIPLPKTLAFDQNPFNLWHTKAKNLRLVAHFALALRYLKSDVSPASKAKLKECLLKQLSSIEAIKASLEKT